jgi:hypothetical protein
MTSALFESPPRRSDGLLQADLDRHYTPGEQDCRDVYVREMSTMD